MSTQPGLHKMFNTTATLSTQNDNHYLTCSLTLGGKMNNECLLMWAW